jgi:hypothetical protein
LVTSAPSLAPGCAGSRSSASAKPRSATSSLDAAIASVAPSSASFTPGAGSVTTVTAWSCFAASDQLPSFAEACARARSASSPALASALFGSVFISLRSASVALASPLAADLAPALSAVSSRSEAAFLAASGSGALGAALIASANAASASPYWPSTSFFTPPSTAARAGPDSSVSRAACVIRSASSPSESLAPPATRAVRSFAPSLTRGSPGRAARARSSTAIASPSSALPARIASSAAFSAVSRRRRATSTPRWRSEDLGAAVRPPWNAPSASS